MVNGVVTVHKHTNVRYNVRKDNNGVLYADAPLNMTTVYSTPKVSLDNLLKPAQAFH